MGALANPQPLTIDLERAEAAVAELLTALGHDVTSERFAATPRRVAVNLHEMLTPLEFTPSSFPHDGYTGLVVVRDIPFHALCEHHLLPFHGVVHLAYLPGERILGLSALAQLVTQQSRGLHLQERLTQQLADELSVVLETSDVGVVVEAQQLCMTLRASRAIGSTTVTTLFTGALRTDPDAQQRLRSAGAHPHDAPPPSIEGAS